MNPEQIEMKERMNSLQLEATHLQEEYWFIYTNIDSWQFWVMLAMVVVPLAVLLFAIDKQKIFLILFYGLNVHVWFAYIDIFGVRRGYFDYPHSLTPFFPFSMALDAALVPVSFLLVYQWTLNHNKNFYLYSIILSAVFAFGLKPILVSANLFNLNKGTNYFHLFLLYGLIFILSRVITKAMIKIANLDERNIKILS